MESRVNVEELLRRVDKESGYPNAWADDVELISVFLIEEWIRELSHKSPYDKQNLIDGMINGGDLPIQQIREMIMEPSPEPQNAPPLNPKAVLHSNITAELNAIYVAKNSDYGDAFGETYKKLGIISAVTRITDKVNRLQSLATKSESERLVKDESIVDSAKDLANYAVMLLIEMGYEPDKL